MKTDFSIVIFNDECRVTLAGLKVRSFMETVNGGNIEKEKGGEVIVCLVL